MAPPMAIWTFCELVMPPLERRRARRLGFGGRGVLTRVVGEGARGAPILTTWALVLRLAMARSMGRVRPRTQLRAKSQPICRLDPNSQSRRPLSVPRTPAPPLRRTPDHPKNLESLANPGYQLGRVKTRVSRKARRAGQ